MDEGDDGRRGRKVTRDELYEEVWSTPISVLASKYGISNVGLAKICRRLKVPTPGRGYWARTQNGQQLPRTPLPRAAPDEITTTVIRPTFATSDPTPTDAPPVEIPLVPIPRTLGGAHEAVAALKRAVDDASVHEGMVVIHGYYDTVLRASKGMVHRALLILNGLCKALDARGQGVQFGKKEDRYRQGYILAARVAGEDVRFQVSERSTKTVRVSTKRPSVLGPEYDYSPTGRLRLNIERGWGRQEQSSWGDGARNRLEDQLGKVILAIEREAALNAEQTRRREEERLAAEAAARRKEEEKRRAAYEDALVKDLQAMAESWERSARLKAFIDAVGSVLTGDRSTEGTRAWLGWAAEHARAIDPLERPETIAKKITP